MRVCGEVVVLAGCKMGDLLSMGVFGIRQLLENQGTFSVQTQIFGHSTDKVAMYCTE